MPPKVPTPSTQGAQNIGSVGLTTNVNTPYQNFQVPVIDKGAAALTAGAAFGSLAKTSTDYLTEDSKRNLLQYDTEASTLRSQLQETVKAAKGQEKLTLIEGQELDIEGEAYSGFDLVETKSSAQQQYQEGITKLRAKYGKSFTADDALSADMADQKSSQVFNVFLNEQQDKAQTAVDEVARATRLAGATQAAVSAIGTATEEVELKKALSVAGSVVTDPKIGTAVKTGIDDPAAIKSMVQVQQGQVVDSVVGALLSEGKFKEAASLVEEYTKKGGLLEGSKAATDLQTKILPFELDGEALAQLDNIVAKARPPNLGPNGVPKQSHIKAQIAKEPDPVKRKRLEAWNNTNNAIVVAARTETMQKEMGVVFKKLRDGIPITVSDIPTVLMYDPDAGSKIISGQGGFDLDRAAAAREQQDWQTTPVDPNASAVRGGTTHSTGVEIFMDNLDRTDPQAWMSMYKNPLLKSLVDKDQWDALSKKSVIVNKKILDAASGYKTSVKTNLTRDFNLTAEAATNLMNKHGITLTGVANDVKETAALKGLKVDPDDIRRALAQKLIQVRSAEGYFVDDFDFTFSKDVEDLGGSPFDMILKDTSRNRRFVATTLNVDRSVIDAIFKGMKYDDRTLKNVAAQTDAGIAALPVVFDAAQKELNDTINTISAEENLPIEFVHFLVDKLGKNPTPDNVTRVFSRWSKNKGSYTPVRKKETLRRWINR